MFYQEDYPLQINTQDFTGHPLAFIKNSNNKYKKRHPLVHFFQGEEGVWRRRRN